MWREVVNILIGWIRIVLKWRKVDLFKDTIWRFYLFYFRKGNKYRNRKR